MSATHSYAPSVVTTRDTQLRHPRAGPQAPASLGRVSVPSRADGLLCVVVVT